MRRQSRNPEESPKAALGGTEVALRINDALNSSSSSNTSARKNVGRIPEESLRRISQ